jgi:hypothetical protein
MAKVGEARVGWATDIRKIFEKSACGNRPNARNIPITELY